jgi:hypothetical protein
MITIRKTPHSPPPRSSLQHSIPPTPRSPHLHKKPRDSCPTELLLSLLHLLLLLLHLLPGSNSVYFRQVPLIIKFITNKAEDSLGVEVQGFREPCMRVAAGELQYRSLVWDLQRGSYSARALRGSPVWESCVGVRAGELQRRSPVWEL